jgi:hypothetical protein
VGEVVRHRRGFGGLVVIDEALEDWLTWMFLPLRRLEYLPHQYEWYVSCCENLVYYIALQLSKDAARKASPVGWNHPIFLLCRVRCLVLLVGGTFLFRRLVGLAGPYKKSL